MVCVKTDLFLVVQNSDIVNFNGFNAIISFFFIFFEESLKNIFYLQNLFIFVNINYDDFMGSKVG